MTTPNSAVFTAENGLTVNGRTSVDAQGIYHNAIGLESSATHTRVSKIWQDQCIPFIDFRDGVKRDAGGKRDEARPLSWVHLDNSLRLPDGCAFTEFGMTTLTSKYQHVNGGVKMYQLRRSENVPPAATTVSCITSIQRLYLRV